MPKIQNEKTAILRITLPKDFMDEVVSFAKKKNMTVEQFVLQTLKKKFKT